MSHARQSNPREVRQNEQHEPTRQRGARFMAIEPQKQSVVSSHPVAAVAVIAAGSATIIAPSAGLWPRKRASEPPAIALK